ncbi:hypothetical protein ACN28S_65585 [Cystobacter fuscus]
MRNQQGEVVMTELASVLFRRRPATTQGSGGSFRNGENGND